MQQQELSKSEQKTVERLNMRQRNEIPSKQK